MLNPTPSIPAAVFGLVILATPIPAQEVNFNMQIRPILSEKCYFCHGPDKAEIKGNLQLHTYEHATSDRDGDAPAIVPGKVEDSLLWERITSANPDDVMPPPRSHMRVTAEEQKLIKAWIEQGAEYEGLWSFQPLPKTVAVPITSAGRVRNSIDPFIQRQLAKQKLPVAMEADSEVLLRRVHLALTGLVPTPEQIFAFKADTSGRAYENAVDRLLQSQAFAEHMTVDWLDVSRYADSFGYQRDNNRQVWPWRDWVLKAFRENMTYDEFIKQQLAGDLMENSNDQMKIATAFNRLHGMKVEGGSVPEEFRTEYVADRAQTAATAFLGLTMECARCHDHKYDPISMEDYYSTFALFNNIDEAGLDSYFTNAVPSPSLPVVDSSQRQKLAELKKAVEAAEKHLTQVRENEKGAYKAAKHQWKDVPKIPGRVAYFSFDADGGMANADDPKQVLKSTAGAENVDGGLKGKGMFYDGDTGTRLGKLGPFARHSPFSMSVAINMPVEHERAIILHRSRAWTDAASKGYELMVREGCIEFALVHFSPGNEIRVRTKSKVAIDTWTRVTVTYDGSSRAQGMGVYLNGQPAEVEVLSDHLTKSIHYGGKMGITLSQRMRDMGFKNSKLDELSIWARELSAGEVMAHHNPKAAYSAEAFFGNYLAAVSKPYQEALAKLEAARKAYNDILDKSFHLMVMKEMPERRKTYVLDRGLYSAPNKNREVQPAPPKEIFPFGEEYSRDRLGFARWLLHPDHPLTARVTVNRYWQMIFGIGIVETTNDFGFQGALPTHPELLDHLSRSFIDSGWDLRALLKTMVMSHTFRQDSSLTADLLERDPKNVWLARGPAHHMTAEMIRDSALLASGSLDTRFGGPGVNANTNRRGVYVHWKRSQPAPEMLIFGTPRRLVCSVKREKTSTPLQPLVLMNSPQFVKASRSLAQKVMADPKTKSNDEAKLADLFQRLTTKTISKDEQSLLQELLQQQRRYFTDDSGVTASFLKVSGGGKDPELAAWTVVANAVMNLDSFYMVR